MKKKRLASLVLALPLALFCACGGGTPELVLNANWYRDPSRKEVETGTKEELEYAVTYEPAGMGDFALSYTDGVYKTSLIDKTEDGVHFYRYTTSLNIKVQFSLSGAKSEVFEDSVTSTTDFLSVREHLRPIKSEVTVKSTSPLTATPSELKEHVAYQTYHYTMTTVYDDPEMEKATLTFTYLDLDEAEREPMEIDIEGDGTYLDNEQIPFALRALSMNASVTFRSINPVKQLVEDVMFAQVPTQVTESVSFELGYFDNAETKTVEESLQAYQVELTYDTSMSGERVTFTYARPTAENTYRNVMLKMKKPILHSLGTMTYTLKKATFNYSL